MLEALVSNGHIRMLIAVELEDKHLYTIRSLVRLSLLLLLFQRDRCGCAPFKKDTGLQLMCQHALLGFQLLLHFCLSICLSVRLFILTSTFIFGMWSGVVWWLPCTVLILVTLRVCFILVSL